MSSPKSSIGDMIFRYKTIDSRLKPAGMTAFLDFCKSLKELKIGFGMPCGDSWANAVFFSIGVIAYNLFIGFKRLSCPEAWVHHTIATFRWKMVQVAGRIVRHAGQVILKLVVDAERLSIFNRIRQRCFELSMAT